jgi:hypothetical protein
MRKRIGISKDAAGVVVRGIKHFSECLVVAYPNDFPDDACTCWDDSPDWTLS